MSLRCLECGDYGAFNTLIIFDPTRKFDENIEIEKFRNYYTCCLSYFNLRLVLIRKFFSHKIPVSRYMIVRMDEFESNWNTDHDGPKLKDTKHMLIDESWLKRKLPRIYKALVTEGAK